MPITVINSPTLKEIAGKIEETLKPLAAELGIAIKYGGGGKYTSSNATIPIEIALLDEKGEAKSRIRVAWEKNAVAWGFEKEDLGQEILINGEPFIIEGFELKSRKYPILAKHKLTGQSYKFPIMTVRKALNETKGTAAPPPAAAPAVAAAAPPPASPSSPADDDIMPWKDEPASVAAASIPEPAAPAASSEPLPAGYGEF